MAHRVVETQDRVTGMAPLLLTRWRWRADRQTAKMNATLRVPFYRWETVRLDGRYAVVAMQNVAQEVK